MMKEGLIQKRLSIDSLTYFKTHFNIVSSVLPVSLTNKQVEVLAHFMDIAFKDGKSVDKLFSLSSKKDVMETLNMSTAGLSNHLKDLVNKEYLVKDEKDREYKLRKFLIPDFGKQGYRFLLENGDYKKDI